MVFFTMLPLMTKGGIVRSLERLLKFVIDDVWKYKHGLCIAMYYSVFIDVNIVVNHFD